MSTRTSRPGGKAQAGGSKSDKGRKTVVPVRVSKGRNWGPIIMFGVVGLIAIGIIGYAAVGVLTEDDRTPLEIASDIDGVVNYRVEQPDMLTNSHMRGPLQYAVLPPVGGDHNEIHQNCQGMVYDAPIAKEHAVHSLEHGAVWITYQPSLAEDQVERLADRVRGVDYMMMSPYPELDAPISLQAWGFQLKVQDAGDGRIDEFIRALRYNARLENATCGQGTANTGEVPFG